MGIKDQLVELKQDTQWILESLMPEEHPEIAGVNWGCLGVVEVRDITTLDDQYFEVIIDEVAPEASDFSLLVQERLSGMGWGIVSVVTEW